LEESQPTLLAARAIGGELEEESLEPSQQPPGTERNDEPFFAVAVDRLAREREGDRSRTLRERGEPRRPRPWERAERDAHDEDRKATRSPDGAHGSSATERMVTSPPKGHDGAASRTDASRRRSKANK